MSLPSSSIILKGFFLVRLVATNRCLAWTTTVAVVPSLSTLATIERTFVARSSRTGRIRTTNLLLSRRCGWSKNRRRWHPLPPLDSTFTADGSEYSSGDATGDSDGDDYDDDDAVAANLRRGRRDDEEGGSNNWDDDDTGDAPTIELSPVPMSKNSGNRFVAVVWDRVLDRQNRDALELFYDRIALTEDHVMFCRKSNLYNETFNFQSMVDVLWSLPMYVHRRRREWIFVSRMSRHSIFFREEQRQEKSSPAHSWTHTHAHKE